jgi:plasmid stabilization system protein ParE
MKWLPEALADVARLHDFLNSKNPQAAARAAAAILDGATILQANPGIGRPMADDTGRREWAIAFGAGAYVLRYRIGDAGEPVIIRVWHSLEDRR